MNKHCHTGVIVVMDSRRYFRARGTTLISCGTHEGLLEFVK